MVEKLLHRLDETRRLLSFSEFEEYFERTAEAMKLHMAAPRQRIKPQARIVSRPEVARRSTAAR